MTRNKSISSGAMRPHRRALRTGNLADKPKLAEWRTWTGAILTILAGIAYAVFIGSVLADFFPPHRVPLVRIIGAFSTSVLALVAAAATLRDFSLLWQFGLRAAAITGLAIGIRLTLTTLLYNWRALLGYPGLIGASCLAVGLGAAALLRRGQKLHRRRRKA